MLSSHNYSQCFCADVNECGLRIDNCHSDATCMNTDGLFECRCPDGFRGDGINCCVSEVTLTALIDAEQERSKSTRRSKSKKRRKGRSGKFNGVFSTSGC